MLVFFFAVISNGLSDSADQLLFVQEGLEIVFPFPRGRRAYLMSTMGLFFSFAFDLLFSLIKLFFFFEGVSVLFFNRREEVSFRCCVFFGWCFSALSSGLYYFSPFSKVHTLLFPPPVREIVNFLPSLPWSLIIFLICLQQPFWFREQLKPSLSSRRSGRLSLPPQKVFLSLISFSPLKTAQNLLAHGPR